METTVILLTVVILQSFIMKLSKNISEIIDEMVDQYLEEDRYNRPWIIGFSL